MPKGPWKSLWAWREVGTSFNLRSVSAARLKGCGKFKVSWTLRLCLANFKCAWLDQDGAVSLLCKKKKKKKAHLKAHFICLCRSKCWWMDAFTLPFALVTYLYSSWINNIWEVHFEKPTLNPKSRMLVPIIKWQDDNTEKSTFGYFNM